MKKWMWVVVGILALLVVVVRWGPGSIRLANYDQEDSTVAPSSQGHSPDLISAFWGFNSEAPLLSSFFVCRGARGSDAMPVVFPLELDLDTLQVGDFRVVRSDGGEGTLRCVTPAPAFDSGEFRTMLLVGDFGSIANPPERVEIKGNLLSIDRAVNFQGRAVEIVPLEDGPSMVLAEPVPEQEWYLGRRASFFPFGGGSGCPAGTKQIVRVTWNGGITKPGGSEVDELERESYTITMRDESNAISSVVPFALGDLGDGDNNHKLCLDVEGTPLKIDFPAGLVTDPRDDLNPETSVEVSQ